MNQAIGAELMCTSNPRVDGQPWEPWEGNGPCQDCGERNVVWTVDNETWHLVMGDAGGLLCPSCFIKRAFHRGIKAVWQLVPEPAAEGQKHDHKPWRPTVMSNGDRCGVCGWPVQTEGDRHG